MKIAVIGTGYVGLVTGTCFAETGNTVTCVDIDKNKIDKLNRGVIPIYEPGLETIFLRNREQNRLFFTTDLEQAITDATFIFLALPTPPGEDGSADLSYVLSVAEKLGELIKDYKIIIDKSTVPVGTGDLVHQAIAKKSTVDFDVVSNPEFLREGVAVTDFMKPDRVVIGTDSGRAREQLEKLYSPFVRQGNPIIFMDIRSAEMTKYAANAYLATRISFMNEIANLCEVVGADVDSVRKGIGSDSRIGKRFLFPGLGYGGSCFPKDVNALAQTSIEKGYPFKILHSVMDVNNLQRKRFLDKILIYFNGKVKGKTIAMWGLAFKPNTDDIREAPAIYLIEELLKAGAILQVFDPEAMENARAIFGDKITYCSNEYETVEGADMLVIVTEWNEFRTPDFGRLANAMKSNVIFDGRNLFELDDMRELGFYYNSIGRELINQ